MSAVSVERDGHLLLIVNRPDAYNLWNLEVIRDVSRADAAEGFSAMVQRRAPIFRGR